MTYRFLIDESVGQTPALHLRAIGLDVESVAELMPRAQDENILSYSVSTQRIVVTIDKDFGDLIFRDGLLHVGVVLLRLDDDTIPNIVKALDRVINEVGPRVWNSFVVVSDRHIRVKRTLHRCSTSWPWSMRAKRR